MGNETMDKSIAEKLHEKENGAPVVGLLNTCLHVSIHTSIEQLDELGTGLSFLLKPSEQKEALRRSDMILQYLEKQYGEMQDSAMTAVTFIALTKATLRLLHDNAV